MTTQATTQKAQTTRRGALLLGIGVGVALAGMVALGGTAQQADAAASDKIVFVSDRTTGKGVSNPTGDAEIFRMSPNGTGLRQLTFNQVDDFRPNLTPDGQKIVYMSRGAQPSNPEGEDEIYVMNASDGSGNRNLTDNRAILDERLPRISPDGQKIAYVGEGEQVSNPQAEPDIYVMNLDGSDQKNLTNTGYAIYEGSPAFSPDGQKIAYSSGGAQASNPDGDDEVYVMNATDGSDQTNLSNNGWANGDRGPAFSPDGQKIVYTSDGPQISNPEGDEEVYVMNADGSAKKNLTNNGQGDVYDHSHYARFSPDGQRVIYVSGGAQTSNPEGDEELYSMNLSDGSGKRNLTNNGQDVDEWYGVFSPDGQKFLYMSRGVQASNPEGETELYLMNATDGSAKKNLTNNDALDSSPEWGR
jgi:Tol biopolymer transport system component